MRNPESSAAAPTGIGNGRKSQVNFSEGNLPAIYPSFGFNSTEFATAFIVDRHNLPRHVASVVRELARLGGRP